MPLISLFRLGGWGTGSPQISPRFVVTWTMCPPWLRSWTISEWCCSIKCLWTAAPWKHCKRLTVQRSHEFSPRVQKHGWQGNKWRKLLRPYEQNTGNPSSHAHPLLCGCSHWNYPFLPLPQCALFPQLHSPSSQKLLVLTSVKNKG